MHLTPARAIPTLSHNEITRRSLVAAAAGAGAGWLTRPSGAFAAANSLATRARAAAAVGQPETAYAPRPAAATALGFNANPTIEHLERIKSIGATYVRMGPGWDGAEDFKTGQLSLPAHAAEAFDFCAEHGLHPVCVAAYGPPRRAVARLQVAAEVPAGSTTIPVSSVPQLQIPCDHVTHVAGSSEDPNITLHTSYYGSLIAAHGTSSVTLAAATLKPLHAGEELTVHRLRYPAIPRIDPSHPSVEAYMRYARWIGDQLVVHGCSGYICLWNEVPWPMDKWDSLARSYEGWTEGKNLPPGVEPIDKLQPILLNALHGPRLPAGVHWINGATDKSAFNSVLKQFEGTPNQPTSAQVSGWREGIHPFDSRQPESQAWDDAFEVVNRLEKFTNFHALAKHLHNSASDIAPIATECGWIWEDPTLQARADLRTIASMWGMGLVPHPGLRHRLTETGQPRPAFEAITRLMRLVAELGSGGSPTAPPAIASVSGNRWPMMSAAFYGSNGAVLLLWQRTFSTLRISEPGGGWDKIASPPAASVTIKLGSARRIVQVLNVRTGEALGRSPIPVADDVVAVRVA